MKPEVVLITGCAAEIGRATAATLPEAGYEVVTARRSEDLQGIRAAMALPLDVADGASIEASPRRAGAVRAIDVLVNNADYVTPWRRRSRRRHGVTNTVQRQR